MNEYICLKKNKNNELENEAIICPLGSLHVVVIEDAVVYCVIHLEYKCDSGMLGFCSKLEWLHNVHEILASVPEIEQNKG